MGIMIQSEPGNNHIRISLCMFQPAFGKRGKIYIFLTEYFIRMFIFINLHQAAVIADK
jgi:hypothetical protein